MGPIVNTASVITVSDSFVRGVPSLSNTPRSTNQAARDIAATSPEGNKQVHRFGADGLEFETLWKNGAGMVQRKQTTTWGRFTSPDPTELNLRLEDPQSWNAYAYVQNNPINFTDPNGEFLFFLPAIAKIGMVFHCKGRCEHRRRRAGGQVDRRPSVGTIAESTGIGNLYRCSVPDAAVHSRCWYQLVRAGGDPDHTGTNHCRGRGSLH